MEPLGRELGKGAQHIGIYGGQTRQECIARQRVVRARAPDGDDNGYGKKHHGNDADMTYRFPVYARKSDQACGIYGIVL